MVRVLKFRGDNPNADGNNRIYQYIKNTGYVVGGGLVLWSAIGLHNFNQACHDEAFNLTGRVESLLGDESKRFELGSKRFVFPEPYDAAKYDESFMRCLTTEATKLSNGRYQVIFLDELPLALREVLKSNSQKDNRRLWYVAARQQE